jgi:hypothetical protein
MPVRVDHAPELEDFSLVVNAASNRKLPTAEARRRIMAFTRWRVRITRWRVQATLQYMGVRRGCDWCRWRRKTLVITMEMRMSY